MRFAVIGTKQEHQKIGDLLICFFPNVQCDHYESGQEFLFSSITYVLAVINSSTINPDIFNAKTKYILFFGYSIEDSFYAHCLNSIGFLCLSSQPKDQHSVLHQINERYLEQEVSISLNNNTIFIQKKSVIKVYKEKKDTVILTIDNSVSLKRTRINDIVTLLKMPLLRIYRGLYVNPDYIVSIDKNHCMLSNNEKIAIPKRGSKAVLDSFISLQKSVLLSCNTDDISSSC